MKIFFLYKITIIFGINYVHWNIYSQQRNCMQYFFKKFFYILNILNILTLINLFIYFVVLFFDGGLKDY